MTTGPASEVGRKLDEIADSLPIGNLIHAVRTLDTAARTLAACASGTNDAELSAAVARMVAQRQRLEDVVRILGQAQSIIRRYRARIAGSDGDQSAAQPSKPLPTKASRATETPRAIEPDEWGIRALAHLPRWRVGQVTGVYVAEDGQGDTIVSGADPSGLHERLHEFLMRRQLLPPWMTKQESTKHVEMKVGFMARTSRTAVVRLAVNKPVCQDPWGCAKLLPHVLGKGQRMIITDPTGSYEFEGTGPA